MIKKIDSSDSLTTRYSIRQVSDVYMFYQVKYIHKYIIGEIKGGRDHRKYPKLYALKVDNKKIENKTTGHKYYKTHVRLKK